VLFGPYGAPIEVQIRTEEMDLIAERGLLQAIAHGSRDKAAEHGGKTQGEQGGYWAH